MKRILLVLSLGAFLAAPAFAQSAGTNTPPANPPPHGPGGPPPGGHLGGMNVLTPEERDQLKSAHDAALAANPALDAEFKDLQEKQKALQEKIKAAMIKADPSVAPILAKMEAAHHHDGPPGGPGGPGQPSSDKAKAKTPSPAH